MKRELHCNHYGRYVDDSYVVSTDREWLLSLVPKIRTFLKERLGLDLHMGKLHIVDVSQGVEFLGAYVRRFRTYISRASVGRTVVSVAAMSIADKSQAWRSINSFLGMMSHYRSYFVRCRVFLKQRFLQISTFDIDVARMNKPSFINVLNSY
jgi:hypothetical protein